MGVLHNWQIIAFFPCGLMHSKRSTVWSFLHAQGVWISYGHMEVFRHTNEFHIFPCFFFPPCSYFAPSCLFFYLHLIQDVSLSAYGLHLITKEWC